MILQVITPESETYDLKISFPKDYVGKQVHCLFYIEEEAKNNVSVGNDLIVPEWHKEIVRERRKNTKREDYINWDTLEKKLDEKYGVS